jgi:hypothetical protein
MSPRSKGKQVRAKAGAFRARRRKASRKSSPPDLDAILGRLSDSLSIVATVTNALIYAQHGTGTLTPHDVGDEIKTLEAGLTALRGVYDEMDVAIREVRT